MKPLYALLLISLGATSVAHAGSPDHTFYMKAGAGGLEEVEGGKLAQEKGGSDAVKSFGEKMVQDHTGANEKLASLAAAKKITLPKRPDAKQRATLKKLGKKSGASFDAAYIKEEIADHKATVALMQREIASGKDADAKAFASETLPVVKEHLGMLQSMKSGSSMHSHSGSDIHSGSRMDSMGGTSSTSTPGSNATGASKSYPDTMPGSSTPGSQNRPTPGAQ